MKNNHTFSENLLLSVGGHLALVAAMLASVHFAIEKAKLVAPDRIEIMEIDLKRVQITRDDTSLYNTEKPAEIQKPEKKEPEKKAPEKKPDEKIGDDKPIDKPALVEDKKPEQEEKKDDSAPKAKTIVRVNRETTSLNRTMTISVIDALRVAMTRCWVIDSSRIADDTIRAVVHLTMAENGMVQTMKFEEEARAVEDPDFAYVLETIRHAVAACQPFRMLPPDEYDLWQKIQLTFYPGSGTIN